MSSRLTLNFGVRWELTTPPREKNNYLTGFDLKTKSIVNGADWETMYRIGATLPSIVKIFEGMGVPFVTPEQAGLPKNMMYLNKWDFNPRAGFAYKFSGGPRPIVMRGGTGSMVTDAAPGLQRSDALQPADHCPLHLSVL